MDSGRGITRRAVLRAGGAAAAAATLGTLAARLATERSAAPKPNVLLVIADDMRADFLPFAEGIQRSIGSAGREFTAARANVSLCQPFRVGLLTGQWSKRHKMLGNGDTRIVPHDNTLARWVQEAGYRTALIGKYLNGAPAMTPKPRGWTTWRQLIGDADPNSYRRLGFSVHDGSRTTQPEAPETEYLRDEVIAFVAGAEPWFCMMTPTNPHFPFEPAPEDESAWSDLQWDTPEDDVSDKPSWYSTLPPLSADAKAGFRDIARGQAREISAVDRAVIAVLDSLPNSARENTLVIFTSDGGISYGEHRNPYAGASKNDFYEHTLRVPLLCRGPGFTAGASNEPVSAEADIARTIVAVTGAKPGLDGDGEDLRAIQDKPSEFADRHLLHERGGGGTNNPNPASGLCVTTATRKLMRWTGRTGRDRYEAYDLDADPNELESWAFDPIRLTERDELEAQLDLLCPPPSLVPALLYGAIHRVGGLPLVTTSLSAGYHSVLILDVFTASSEPDNVDLEIAGDCLDNVELLAADERTDELGVVRRLMSFAARGTGLAGTVSVSAEAQRISTMGLSVAEYEYGTAVVQSLAEGSGSESVSFGISLDPLQGDRNTSHFAVLTGSTSVLSPADDEAILYGGVNAEPAAGFAVLWAPRGGNLDTSSATATPSWSVVASEIGT